MSEEIPKIHTRRAGEHKVRLASAVWLVPIAALVVSFSVGLTAYRDQGPIVQIVFDDASGIIAKETEVRFRDVSVGVVENVSFNDDLTRVLVDVRIDKDVAPFVDEDASFWIVRPEISTSGITGLDTVFSGIYIEGTWDNDPSETVSIVPGLKNAPLKTANRQGTVFELRTFRDGGLADNSPILFKGIEVGRIGPAQISGNGRWIYSQAIIYEPHDQLVFTTSRFWDTSGFTFSVGINGAELDFGSIASLIAGGVTFDTLVSGGEPLRDGMVFDVFESQAAAREAIFNDNDGETLTVSMIFEDNASGLTRDAAVEWRGVRIGEVLSVNGLVDEERFGDGRVRLLATVDLKPSRLGFLEGDDPLTFLSNRVDEGLRARLVNASLLTGGLKIELLEVEDAPEDEFLANVDPFPIFPVTDSDLPDISGTAEGLITRVNNLPVEELLDSAIAFLDSATAFVTNDDLQQTPGEIRGLLSDARGVIGSDEVQALPGELRTLVANLQSASGDLSALLKDLRDAQAVERLMAAVDTAGTAAASFDTAMQGVPALTEQVTQLAGKANALPIEDMIAQATGLAEEARGFVASDAMQAVPGSITKALDELAVILTGMSEAKTVEALNSALREAGEAAEAIEVSVAGVPNIVARIDRIAASAEEINLDELAKELESVLNTASRLFGDASDAELPAALAGALREMDVALKELREGGAVTNLNATMVSAQEAAAAIEKAADTLPNLVVRIRATLGQAQTTLADFDEDSTFGRDTAAALREIRRAAEALGDLARTIERNPNSLILGR
ncbi:MAG: MlaD family protein [Pseudomonadota bacterium]